MRPLELDQVLAIKPDIRAEVVGAGSVFLIGERQRFVLADPRVVRIASLVDGKRAVEEILMRASPEMSPEQTLYVLDHLAARGHLVEATPELPAESAAFWHGVGLDAPAVAASLERTPVRVRSIGGAELAGWMGEVLAESGVCVNDQAVTQVVVTDDYLRPELAAIDAEARKRNAPWFIVQLVGTRPLIGPFFRANDGPCWHCLAFWLRNNRPVEELVRRHNGGAWVPPPRAVIGASARAAASIGALAVVRELTAQAPSNGRAQLLALDLVSFQTSAHVVVRRPQCPACGDPRNATSIAEAPITLAPVPKQHCSDGGYRSAPPEETWQRYGHLVSPISGAVSYVVPVPERTNDLRVVYASGYLACPRSEIPRGNAFDKACAGKGRSAIQAKTSALCEALERFSGVYQGDEARIRTTANELGDLAILPAALTNFSDAQHREAESSGQSAPRHRAPVRLPGDVAIDWAPAYSLMRRQHRYVPLTYCYAEAPAEAGTAFCDPCGNGAAAGTCLEEAILQGLLELVERDAVAIWWYNRVARPGVELQSFAEPYFMALQADYARLGWKLWALDLTHDLGIPTFAALAHQPGEDRFAIGFGSHLDARLAVQRALTEVNQLFDPTAARRAPWDLDRLPDRTYLFPDSKQSAVSASHFEPLGGADLRADVECCVERLGRAELDALVVNKTRPDIGLTVVQAIVPGLRHFWPRFGSGRLYEVPHALGWVTAKLNEEDLNPVPLLV